MTPGETSTGPNQAGRGDEQEATSRNRPPQPSGLRDHLGYWLRRLSDEVHISFERTLAARQVTVAQWTVLRAAYAGLTTPAEVADYLALDPGAVTRLVDRLVAKGLLLRATDPQDRRLARLHLTEQGRALTPVLAALADHNDAAFFAILTAAERAQFATLLARLLRAREIDMSGWRAVDEADLEERRTP